MLLLPQGIMLSQHDTSKYEKTLSSTAMANSGSQIHLICITFVQRTTRPDTITLLFYQLMIKRQLLWAVTDLFKLEKQKKHQIPDSP